MRKENQLPKNIRQIGSPIGNVKLYIEDFVIAFLNELAKDDHTYVRGAILFGEKKIIDKDIVIFIRGAMEGENIELDLDETVFNDEVWKEIYQKKDLYFSELEVMGWALSRMGFSIKLNDKIKKTHFENFPGEGKVLYVVDSLEGEDAFYIYRGRDLIHQCGYYVYYEKNPMMQEYMISRKEKIKEMITYESMQEAKRDERIVKQFRSVVKEKKRKTTQKKFVRYASSAASMLLFLILVGSAIYTVQGNKTQSFQDAVDGAAQAMGDGANAAIEEKETTEVQKTKEEQRVYTIKKGDKLVRICKKVYGSEKYLKYILSANKLKADDKIYPGEKIIIPSISN